jgi:7,8-dihydropterin-6-yl-methyl-4-(beta-D-ribofuranosyl)aminobenzene 5'-phosphate synthase
MKIIIIYDNEALKAGLSADWGFSCLVQAYDKNMLFDTGAKGYLLLENMRTLNIDPAIIDEVVISHAHWDHTGGLSDFLKINPVKVYVPPTYSKTHGTVEIIKVREPEKIHEHIYLTGELKNIEQSLVVDTDKGLVVIAGCSHPGVESILNTATQWGEIYALIGGLHGFSKFDVVKDLNLICPTHCTQHKSEIKSLYPDKYIQGGAGQIIEI